MATLFAMMPNESLTSVSTNIDILTQGDLNILTALNYYQPNITFLIHLAHKLNNVKIEMNYILCGSFHSVIYRFS
jgi:hypothetical protein